MAPEPATGGRGAIAAGHPITAQVGADVLADGGNAVDACVAAGIASWVCEPTVTAIGAGGFMLVHDEADGSTELLDFFAAVPGHGAPPGPAPEMVPVVLDFGTTTQTFYVGPASCAVPGVPRGLWEAHQRHGTLPWARLVEPAVGLARDGFALTAEQEGLQVLLDELLRLRRECAEVFVPGGRILRAGDRMRNEGLAVTLERMAEHGADELYRGETAEAIVAYLAAEGGLITAEDLAAYEVIVREPLSVALRAGRLAINPPPSAGGVLIAHTLAVLARLPLAADPWDVPSLLRVVGALRSAQGARGPELERALYQGGAHELLLSDQRLGQAAAEVAAGIEPHTGEPNGAFGTTHVSVLDAAGNAASMTCSSGCGSGVLVGDTGVHLNNMLGESDLATDAVALGPGDRLTSMMSPAMILAPHPDVRGRERVVLALGSSGSARIRSAMVQVIVRVLAQGLDVGRAISLARAHPLADALDCEGGFDVAAMDGLEAAGEQVVRWPISSGYFGGTQAVERAADGELRAAGDPRRGGTGLVVR